MAWQTGGTILAVAGLAVLYAAWQRKARNWPLVLVGWALLAGSVASTAQVNGTEKGWALGILVAVLAGLIALGALALSAPVKTRRQVPARPAAGMAAQPDWRAKIAPAARIAAIVLLGLPVSLAGSTALFMGSRAAGVEHTANLTTAMFAFPLIWASLSTMLAYSDSARTRTANVLGMAIVSGAVIAATMGRA